MTASMHHIDEATRRQTEASDPKVSAWVMASAGSGKTKVLTDRFLRLLLDGARPQHILCLTYTRAAAAEMIDRLMKRLGQWAIMPENSLADDIQRLTQVDTANAVLKRARRLFAQALDCPGGLRIKTFHAFAQEILARFPLEAGAPPHFTPLEEDEARQLQETALDHLLGPEGDTTAQTAWAHLIGALGPEATEGVLRTFMHEAEHADAALAHYGGPDGLAMALCAHAGVDPDATPETHRLADCADASLPMDDLRRTTAILTTDPDTNATLRMAATDLATWLAMTPEKRCGAIGLYRNCFLTNKHEPRIFKLNQKILGRHPDLAATLHDLAADAQRRHRQEQRVARTTVTRAIVQLGARLRQAYRDAKAARAALDFDDIITRTDDLLHQEGHAAWVLWKLDGGIDHIMIDEAQDTSPAQWRIIRALTDEFFSGIGAHDRTRTLFVVGDEKQSIYSFQHADPQGFRDQRTYFRQRIEAAGQVFVSVPLNISFRAAPGILRTVDDIFHHDATRNGVSDDAITHRASKETLQGHVEIWPIRRGVVRPDDDGWQPGTTYDLTAAPHAALAREIAERIRDWCRNGHMIGGALQPVRPGDIMILVRRRNELVPALVNRLKELNVPVSGVDRMVLNDQIGVRDLLALIQVALLPEDDLNLACVLRGPLVGIDEITLEDMCHLRPQGASLWQALHDANAPLLRAARLWLEQVRAHADQMTPYQFLSMILSESSPAARSGRLALRTRLDADATDPIDELLNHALDYAQQHPPGLQGFLHAVQRDAGELKRDLDQGAGEVRIMTVHASKGLQAPIVILPDCCGVPRSQDMAKLQWDADTRLPCYTGGPEETRDPFAAALHQKAQTAQLAEYRRLLYVALTRAERQLYIYGYVNQKEPTEDSWYRLITTTLCPGREAEPGQPLLTLTDQPAAPPMDDKTEQVPPPARIALPDWALAPAAPETPPRHLTPSQLAEADDAPASPAQGDSRRASIRGRLLHLLLQYLPDRAPATRQDAARRFLDRHDAALPEKERLACVAEVLRLLDDPRLAPLFAPGSRAEVSVAGTIGSLPINGQIDRLAVTEDAVLIADYKTNRPPPVRMEDAPLSYLRQMAAYRALLRRIEPGKTVRCFLIWTYTGAMMELEDSVLAGLDLKAA